MTVQVTYNGNPNHQRSFEVKVDGQRVADIPLAHLAFRNVAVNDFRAEPDAQQIAALEDKLTTAFDIAYANVDVGEIKAQAHAPRTVHSLNTRTRTPTTELVAPVHAGAYQDLALGIRNNIALDLLKPDATVAKIHEAERAAQAEPEKLGYII